MPSIMAMSTEWLPLGPIEQGVNRILALDPASADRLAPLAGRELGLSLTDAGMALRVIMDTEGLTLIHDDTDMSDCDVVLEATVAGLTGLVLSRGQRSHDVAFRGDIGTIQEIRGLFADLDVDLEAQLGRLIGDSLAVQVTESARTGWQWGQHSLDTLARNVGELATEERRWLPSQPEVDQFLEDVDSLRESVDRLEARLRRLTTPRDGA